MISTLEMERIQDQHLKQPQGRNFDEALKVPEDQLPTSLKGRSTEYSADFADKHEEPDQATHESICEPDAEADQARSHDEMETRLAGLVDQVEVELTAAATKLSEAAEREREAEARLARAKTADAQ